MLRAKDCRGNATAISFTCISFNTRLIYIQWQSLQEFKQSGEVDDLTLIVRHLRFIFAIVLEALAIYGMILQLMSDSPLAE